MASRKKLNCLRKLSLFVRKKLVTNNKKLVNSYICHSGCPNYQITPVVFPQVGWGGGEVVCG